MSAQDMPELPELPLYAAPSDEGRDWTGWLTVENVGHVARALEERLVGQTFTQVMMWEYNGWQRPEARTGCRIRARDRPGTKHGIKWDVADWDWAASGKRAHVGFSAGNYSLDFSSTLAEQPKAYARYLLPEGDRGSCHVRFAGMSIEFQELTPEGRGSRVLLVVEPRLKHVEAAVARLHELALSRKDDELARLAENAEWELERG